MTPAERWVDEVARTTRPDRVVWCDGSEAENERPDRRDARRRHAPAARTRSRRPGCTLHRSHPDGRRAHRAPDLHLPAASRRTRARPTTGWRPTTRGSRVGPLFDGAMKGRTMYVVPYVMGPLGSPFSKVGVEITDSPYVVANMRIMTRMGKAALDAARRRRRLRARPALHSATSRPTAASSSTSRRSGSIWSVGSGYGGNALLGQEVLRAAHRQHHGARPGLAGRAHADPGARAARTARRTTSRPPSRAPAARRTWPCCVSPLRAPGLQGADGRRRHRLAARRARTAACGRSTPRPASSAWCPARARRRTRTRWRRSATNTIFTNVAVTPDGVPVVGGQGQARRPPDLIDWQGKPWDRHGQGRAPELALHRARAPVPEHVAALGGPAGRADLRDHLRRPARAAWRRSSSRAATGSTACSSAPPWARRRRPRRPGRSASCAATRWPCCRSAATTWATTSRHWLRMGRSAREAARRSSTSTGSAPDDGRPLPVAGLRREPARAAVDDRPREGPGRRGARRRSASCRRADALNLDGLDLSRADVDDAAVASTATSGRPRCRRSARSSTRFGDRLPESLGQSLDALAQQLTAARV